MSARNVVSWASAISNLVRIRRPLEAIELFKSMLVEGEKPNFVAILSLGRAIGLTGSEDLTGEIHGFVIKTGLDSQACIVTSILGLYSVHGMSDALRLFDETPRRDLILWTAMISACTKNKQFSEAIDKFREMRCFGMQPNNVSVVSVLPACAHLAYLLSGKELHAFSAKREFYTDCNLQNALVDFYSKCGNLKDSMLVFEQIPVKDIVSWNTITRACFENNTPRKGLSIFRQMAHSHVKPDETTVLNVLMTCSQLEEVHFGLSLHCYIVKGGFSSFIFIGTTLLTLYSSFGEVELSQRLFDALHTKDVVAWTAMVSVYAQSGPANLALETFKNMQKASEKPNEVTFVSLLHACSKTGAQIGESIHGHVIRKGYAAHLFVNSALIDFYCRLGRIGQGKALFDQMPRKDFVGWSSMINGYGMNGCGREALDVLSNMLEQGLKPNDVVFMSILSACSHCGLLDEGWEWFSCMESKYRVTPNVAHYSCIVDLLSRRGMIEEAISLIRLMQMEPDATIWAALLGGCRMQIGDHKIMEQAAKELIRLDPSNSSYYVILSNLYAAHGQWEDVERLRQYVEEQKLRKTAGYSMVEAA